jgi:hypothetical protein
MVYGHRMKKIKPMIFRTLIVKRDFRGNIFFLCVVVAGSCCCRLGFLDGMGIMNFRLYSIPSGGICSAVS